MNPETYLERPLPHSKDSEQFVLGCILVGNPKAPSVFDWLRAKDFFENIETISTDPKPFVLRATAAARSVAPGRPPNQALAPWS